MVTAILMSAAAANTLQAGEGKVVTIEIDRSVGLTRYTFDMVNCEVCHIRAAHDEHYIHRAAGSNGKS
jgi:hypothetical protein